MARRRPATVHGLLVVDKPAGVTSHDVVDQVRRRLGERRVGHAGTLDPDATGVLLVGVGSVTRLLRFLTALGKSYTGEVVLGVETDTLDAAGAVTARHEMGGIDLEAGRRLAAEHLVGPIMQVPPMVSALKVGGRRLHELAREGVEVERAPRPVVVHSLELDGTDDPGVWQLAVTCSSGTYIRSIAADLGRLLGGGAHLRALRRTAVGSFGVADAAPVETARLLTPREALRDLAEIAVDAETAAGVRHGRFLERPDEGQGPWAVIDQAGDLLAVYEVRDERLVKPAVVLAVG